MWKSASGGTSKDGRPARTPETPKGPRHQTHPGTDRGDVRALRGAQSGPEDGIGLQRSLHAARLRRAVGPSDRCIGQPRDARSVRSGRHAGKDGRARRRSRERDDKDHWPVPEQGEERRRTLEEARRRTWRQGAPMPGGPGSPSRRRTQDRQCGAQRRLWRTDHRHRHAHFQCLEPDRPRTGQDTAKGRGDLRTGHSRPVQAQRPSLAHLAWTLCMQGPQARMLALRDPRSLHL